LRIILILIFCACVVFNSIGQSRRVDSLVKIFQSKHSTANKNNLTSDTVFANYAHQICNEYINENELFAAIKYNKIEQLFYEKLKRSYNNTAYLNRIQYRCAYARISILERKEDYNEALDLSFALLQTLDTLIHKERILLIQDEIGYIYYLFGNLPKALFFYTQSCELAKKTGDLLSIGRGYTNLYGIYSAMGDNVSAIKYCFSALNCFKKINYKHGMRIAYGNLAQYYEYVSPDKALQYILLSKEISSNEIDYVNPAFDEKTLGGLYLKKASTEKNPAKRKEFLGLSEKNLTIALQTGHQLKNKAVIKESNNSLAMLENERGNFQKAYEYLRISNSYQDSLRGEENSKASTKSLLKYEFDKKEQQQQLLNDKKEAVKQKEVEKQSLLKNFFILGFVLVSVFAILLLRSFKAKQKANGIILKQKAAAENQKQIIETKQAQLLQSINYAQKIQDNLLKSEEDLQEIIKNSFIIFKPRDIVSGDFYWFTKTQTGDIIIALADCTGHGVPGALLSMIGITALNEIVSHQQVHDPVEILLRLSSDMHDAFSKEKNVAKMDGMDFSVCKISPSQNKLFFAGVNQGLYILNNSQVFKIEPQVNSINGIFDINTNEKIKSTEINLESGISVYLFTDGIIDQIGEASGKKYLSARFEESLNNKPGNSVSVKENIISSLNNWQGNYKQIDDITVIGITI